MFLNSFFVVLIILKWGILDIVSSDIKLNAIFIDYISILNVT
jgi:hypothetical protein